MSRLVALLRSILIAIALMAPASNVSAAKTPVSVDAGSLQLFSTESEAQRHCPRDVVVWLNTNSGIYHEKGMRWYGCTPVGAYVCRKEAGVAGDRDTKNGQ